MNRGVCCSPMRSALLATLAFAAAASPASFAIGPAGIVGPPPTPLTIVVVRHAEKASDTARDPELSDAGHARARALAAALRDEPLVAAWSSDFRRTRQTAAPAAQAHGLDVRTYDAALPAEEFARQLRRAHASGFVLVVGHSNTVPGIVAALCGCEVDPIDESVYGGRYDVRFDADGRATLTVSHFPA